MKQKVFIILMLKDVDDGAGLYERDLQKVNVLFETSRVDCKGKFLEEIKDFHMDIMLSDHFLPPFNSIEALKIKLQEKARHSFYFGYRHRRVYRSRLKESADDCLPDRGQVSCNPEYS